MVFSSTIFLFLFLPVFLTAYFLAKPNFRNYVALGFSLLFYAWGAPFFIYLLMASAGIDFWLSRKISEKRDKKKWLLLGLSMNIGLLLYFKYANFFVENFQLIFPSSFSTWIEVGLPIGISFATFQKMSYLVDIYRKDGEAVKKFSDYLLFVTLFPQLIAGPIVRFKDISNEIISRKENYNHQFQLEGAIQFIIGLSKKILIANVLGEQVDVFFSHSLTSLSTEIVWLGMLAYSFQIYFDFSGYSDMAIGLGKIMGFHFPENFNFPYVSKSITEFWRRWHITLSNWMKDYLYIPLGGNKVSNMRLYANLCVVFLISGIWHGASWNFLIWGGYHGLFLVADRLFLKSFLGRTGKLFSITFTFLLVLMGWVLFRFESIEEAITVFNKLFYYQNGTITLELENRFLTMLVMAILFSFTTIHLKWFERLKKQPVLLCVMAILLLIICISTLLGANFNPFIYFRF